MDTMFPGLIVEKYTISMWRYPSGWWITVRVYDNGDLSAAVAKHQWQVPMSALKQEDLLHLVSELHQEVAANTE